MLPNYEDLFSPILKIMSRGEIMRRKEIREVLGKELHLSQELMNLQYESGNGEVFSDRISWALSYLFIAGLLERPRRGDYRISGIGRDLLQYTPEKLKEYVRDAFQRHSNKRKAEQETSKRNNVGNIDSKTPQEVLDDSYNKIKDKVSSEILATILRKKPYEFERLVVKLLQAMGYGGEVKNAATVTKISNDGGIDGIIKEDILGFNHISIQAKRYSAENNVGINEVQSFAGAVSATPSKKGVFITTSDFSKSAVKFVDSLNGSPTIILINGSQLTEYMLEYGFGLQVQKVLRVMKMDMDFWDMLEDE